MRVGEFIQIDLMKHTILKYTNIHPPKNQTLKHTRFLLIAELTITPKMLSSLIYAS